MAKHHHAMNDAFYRSVAWQQTRQAYGDAMGWLCERCRARGVIQRGSIVHHKRYLGMDPAMETALAWDNLELLCLDCHNREHMGGEPEVRVNFDASGMPAGVTRR